MRSQQPVGQGLLGGSLRSSKGGGGQGLINVSINVISYCGRTNCRKQKRRQVDMEPCSPTEKRSVSGQGWGTSSGGGQGGQTWFLFEADLTVSLYWVCEWLRTKGVSEP